MNIYEEPVFTIGQFAAMHGINKKTLMWYDEIGLLKPAFVRANGYRCYTYKQSGMLETILMLRALHMPISWQTAVRRRWRLCSQTSWQKSMR